MDTQQPDEKPTFTQFAFDDELEPSPTPEELKAIKLPEEIENEEYFANNPLPFLRHEDIPKRTPIYRIRFSDAIERAIQPPQSMEMRIVLLQPEEYYIQLRCRHPDYPTIVFNILKIALRGFALVLADPLIINLWYTPSLCESNIRPQQYSTHGGVICTRLETGSQVSLWLDEQFDPTRPHIPFIDFLQAVKGYREIRYASLEERKPEPSLLFQSIRVYKKRWIEAIGDEETAYHQLLRARFSVKITLALEPGKEDIFNVTTAPNHDFGGIVMEEGQMFQIFSKWKTFQAYTSEMQAGFFNASGIFMLTITNLNKDDLLRIEAPNSEFM
ncbi:hypothetical protein AA313_de0202936 [Arthrobotrys entomopaga]|nr:hypothetical protein AA313_de0202936 [Arthrobotrys entomopaga]